MTEASRKSIISTWESKQWKGLQVHPFSDPISHSLFVDDTLLMGQATMEEAKVIKRVISNYCSYSGQICNSKKSKIFFLNINPIVKTQLTKFWGFQCGLLPCKYLGLPFFLRKEKHAF